jgi:two-component system sensor histidine kinase KdpD
MQRRFDADRPSPSAIVHGGLPPRRRAIAVAMAAVGLPLMTVALSGLRDTLGLAGILLIYLTFVVAVATVGGLWPAIVTGLAAALLLNWFFTPPLHTLAIDHAENLLAIVVFVIVAATVSVLVDREARARAEAAGAAELVEVNELRTAILAAVSHDLRTPLASIKASVSSLRQPDVLWTAQETGEFLATIEEEADRLNNLVGNLLDMSRIQTGSVAMERRPIGLDEVVPKALASLPDGGRGIEVDVPESLPRVAADAALLERAIANVAANARSWSPPGERVRILGSSSAGRVELRVVDRGPGIPAADRSRVFEPFQRLGDQPAGGGDGVGLGLAVARGFVEAMGGELVIEETPGGGLTMVLAFEEAA